MNRRPSDVDARLIAWLEEGPSNGPEEVLSRTFARARSTRQDRDQPEAHHHERQHGRNRRTGPREVGAQAPDPVGLGCKRGGTSKLI